MKIKDYNDMMGHLLRKGTPEQAKRAEENNKKYLADRKAKTLKYYGLENEVIGKTKELSENKITTKQRPFNPQELKPGNTFDDVTRNFLIEESKARDLGSEEIQYLMTDEYYRNKKPSKKPVLKDRPVRKPKAVPPKTKTIKTATNPVIDFTPIELDAYKTDPEIDLLKKRIDEMQEQSKQEKIKNQNSGIGYLAGGSKAYE